MEQRQSKSVAPTDEGKTIITNGSYEYNLYQAIPTDKGIEQAELMVNINSKKTKKDSSVLKT